MPQKKNYIIGAVVSIALAWFGISRLPHTPDDYFLYLFSAGFMMVAWYFATALAKQREAILPYFEQQRLEPWTHNKAIQKAIESRRISAEDKAYLRTLRVKIGK